MLHSIDMSEELFFMCGGWWSLGLCYIASFLFNIFLCVIYRYFTRKLHMRVNFIACVCNNVRCLFMCFIFYN